MQKPSIENFDVETFHRTIEQVNKHLKNVGSDYQLPMFGPADNWDFPREHSDDVVRALFYTAFFATQQITKKS